MLSPYGLELVESCITCEMRQERSFCDLPATAIEAFEDIKHATTYPPGAVLFVEGQSPRGIFVLCQGTVKLSIDSPNGRTMIVKLAEPGEVLGLSATISGSSYEATAETLDPCQVNFVKREDFLRFLKGNAEACYKVAVQLSERYQSACKEMQTLGMPHSAGERMARLLLEWGCSHGEGGNAEPQTTVKLTHEEIAQMIGTSRETVTRLFADMKKRQIVESKGSTLTIRDLDALRKIANHN